MSIKKAIASMQFDIERRKVKFCHRCKRLHVAVYPSIIFSKKVLVCDECSDTELECETGCRFGRIPCNHPDCGHSLN